MAGQPKHTYDLTDREQKQVDAILERMEEHGGLFRVDRDGEIIYSGEDNQPIPLEWVVLKGKRYCVDKRGRIWIFGAEKMKKSADGTGAPFRHDSIQMWTGHWRKVRVGGTDEEPEYKYAKQEIWVSVGAGVNQHDGISHLDFYEQRKGFKHPHDAPHVPTAAQIRSMEASAEEMAPAIFAMAQEHAGELGLKTADMVEDAADAPAPKKPAKRKRTNRKKTDAA